MISERVTRRGNISFKWLGLCRIIHQSYPGLSKKNPPLSQKAAIQQKKCPKTILE